MVYPSSQAPKSLKQQKVAITVVEQEYKQTNICYNYRTGSGIIYREMGKYMEIERQRNNIEGHKPKYYNCNKFGHLVCNYRNKKKKAKGKLVP